MEIYIDICRDSKKDYQKAFYIVNRVLHLDKDIDKNIIETYYINYGIYYVYFNVSLLYNLYNVGLIKNEYIIGFMQGNITVFKYIIGLVPNYDSRILCIADTRVNEIITDKKIKKLNRNINNLKEDKKLYVYKINSVKQEMINDIENM